MGKPTCGNAGTAMSCILFLVNVCMLIMINRSNLIHATHLSNSPTMDEYEASRNAQIFPSNTQKDDENKERLSGSSPPSRSAGRKHETRFSRRKRTLKTTPKSAFRRLGSSSAAQIAPGSPQRSDESAFVTKLGSSGVAESKAKSHSPLQDTTEFGATATDLPPRGRRIKRYATEDNKGDFDKAYHKERRWEFMIGATIMANGLGIFLTLLIQGVVFRIKRKRLKSLGKRGRRRRKGQKSPRSGSWSSSHSSGDGRKPRESLVGSLTRKLSVGKPNAKGKKSESGEEDNGGEATPKHSNTSATGSRGSGGSAKRPAKGSGSQESAKSGASTKSRASNVSKGSKK